MLDEKFTINKKLKKIIPFTKSQLVTMRPHRTPKILEPGMI